MENHPIPQDVTGFQFKLIGDMTIKQFAYLATGSFFAYLFYASPLPSVATIPLAFLCASVGASMAFIPIAGRPLDNMLAHFIKALFTPNQYIYQKVGGHLAILAAPQHMVKTTDKKQEEDSQKKRVSRHPYQLSLRRPKNKLDEKETVFFSSVSSLFGSEKNQTNTPSRPRLISMEIEGEKKAKPSPFPKMGKEDIKDILEKEALLVKRELEEAKKEEVIHPEAAATPVVHEHVVTLEKQLQDILFQKEQLEKQLLTLQHQLDTNTNRQNVFAPSMAQTTQETSHVRKIPKNMSRAIGIPITLGADAPNLVAGVVKDARGNILPNILVEVKDKDGNPVRAFKTNALGQFSSATPLGNGIYTVTFDDPKKVHTFDVVEITATGDIMLPIEILSTDAREELRRSLFNQKP